MLITITTLTILLTTYNKSNTNNITSLKNQPKKTIINKPNTNINNKHTTKKTILKFTQYIHDNNIKNFKNPNIKTNKSLNFHHNQNQLNNINQKTLQKTFQTYQKQLKKLTFKPKNFNQSKIKNKLIKFTTYMHDPKQNNLPNFPNPNLTNFKPNNNKPFNKNFNFQNSTIQKTLKTYQNIFNKFHFNNPNNNNPNNNNPTNNNKTNT